MIFMLFRHVNCMGEYRLTIIAYTIRKEDGLKEVKTGHRVGGCMRSCRGSMQRTWRRAMLRKKTVDRICN